MFYKRKGTIMRKGWKRVISLLFVVALCLSTFGGYFTIFAAETEKETQGITESETLTESESGEISANDETEKNIGLETESEPKAMPKKETEKTVKSGSDKTRVNSAGTDATGTGVQLEYNKTFKVCTGGGIFKISDLKGNQLAELKEGQEKTLNDVGEVRIEAIADDGYYVSSYVSKIPLGDGWYKTPDSLYSINESNYKRGHYLTLESDEVFEVSFSTSKTVKPVTRAMARAAADSDNPSAGDSWSGSSWITYNGHPNVSYNGTGYITCTSGEFKGDTITLNTCASGHDYAAPQTGQTGTYTVTVTSIKNNVVTCHVYWSNDANSSNYQNLEGYFSYSIVPEGELTVYKGINDVSNFVVTYGFYENMDLRATFGVYSDEDCKNKVGQIKTDKDGNPIKDGLTMDAGTYYIKELVAPTGFALNDTVKKVKVGSGSSKAVTIKDKILRAKVTGVKIDALTGDSKPTQGLSLAGAEYGVYSDKSCTKQVAVGVTDSAGNIDFNKTYWAYGTYFVKEIKAPDGYLLDPEIQEIVIDEKLGYYSDANEYRLNDFEFVSEDTPDTGTVKVKKISSNVLISEGNNCYSLEGATFKLTNVETGIEVDELLVTDANGDSQEITLLVGRYSVEEITAPKGFILNTEKFVIEVKSNQLTVFELEDEPSNDPVRLLLMKIDSETGEEIPQGKGTFEGAEYTFQYYDGYYSTEAELQGVTPLRTWVLATNTNGRIILETANKISGDDFYLSKSGNRTFPLGTYVIQETKAPEGYKLDSTVYIQNITAEDGTGKIIKSYQTPTSTEQIKRGDLKGVKISAGDMNRMGGIPFRLTSMSTEESHVVVTDKNGQFNTSSAWNPHSQNTNRGEAAEDGIWFGELEALDDSKGALLYDDYLVEELACEANKDRILFPPFKVTISRDMTTIDVGTVTNEYSTEPEIGTTATDKDTGAHYAYASKDTSIVDEVRYENLTAGAEYTIKGVLMDKATGKPSLVSGKEITAEKTFTAKKANGTVELEFTFDSSALQGKEVVVFEYLYKDGKEVTTHTDITDEGQTVRFKEPEIGTTATDKETGSHDAYASDETTIIDVVAYSNLITGKEYVINGILMDKTTGKPLTVNGKEVTAEKTFTANKSSGSVKLEFTLDSSALKGKEVVAFEHLYYDDKEVAAHADINDKGQTVKFKEPEIGTTASEKETGKKEITVGKKVTIVDVVKYKGLIAGSKYTVKGVLMDKKTGKPLTVNGKEITAEKTFTAKKANGTVSLEFTFDASTMGNQEIVVFESLYYNGREIAAHADIKDKAQTVKIVKANSPTTTTGTTTGTTTNSPKTGDATNILLYILLVIISLGGLLAYLIKKGKLRFVIRK